MSQQVMVRPWVKIVGVILIVAGAIFGISKFTGLGGTATTSDNTNEKSMFSGLFGG